MTLLGLVAVQKVEAAFRVCGNYCGPGWCNGKWLAEADCDDSVAPETWSLTGPSCADSCCKMHDECCGHGSDRSVCNTKIVDCLGKCNKASVTCTLDGVPVPAGGIEAAMDIVEGWCCGAPCSVENPRFPNGTTKAASNSRD
eukprot:CAMPEP_0114507988 /NCGR_PEP_ID=MMETSP0109-20121206/12333_1 /TAXON_ID=29199 /ORGANISM="Chlorarachnion reptans, Strain CCCM449" /LENGTH=141 /DNA_ID=CAMNT_0001686837 /DNA_START=100 /DNA_END=525 /DNA_ORIENTATION=+